MLRVIERTNFGLLPDDWPRRVEVRSLRPVRCVRGGDYLFYNPHKERALTYNDDWDLVRAKRASSPTEHLVLWNFSALVLFESELDGEIGVD